MRIMVFDVAASEGGALTILKHYYDEAVKDTQNQYIFVLSLPKFENTENVTVLNFPEVKKSWFKRLSFDRKVAPKLVKKYNADEVLSLQDVIVPKVKIKQTLYLHQPLPFCVHKFSLFKDTKLWAYQNLISKLIYKSVRKADKVIVQTNWVKAACVEKIKADPNKIVVELPKIDIKTTNEFIGTRETMSAFFYPANAARYKNHKVVVDACINLKREKVNDYKVYFTLKGNESKHISKLYKTCMEKELPIEWIGYVDPEDIYDYYARAILLFPSFLETLGLPLMEAKAVAAPVIASDLPFSREVLGDYGNAEFFNYEDVKELCRIMKRHITFSQKN